jgi:hypothetical protein
LFKELIQKRAQRVILRQFMVFTIFQPLIVILSILQVRSTFESPEASIFLVLSV